MRVSVVIPLFEMERYVGAAIDSVLAQTRPVFEIIVVDDGSTDDGAAIAASYGPPVRLVRQARSGAGSARNHGARLAGGDAFTFLDADDLVPHDRFERQVGVLEASPEFDGVFGVVEEFAAGDVLPGTAAPRPPRSPQPARLPGSMLVRREGFERVGPFNESLRRTEAVEWVARCDDAGLLLRMMPEVALLRRLHQSSTGTREMGALGEYVHILKAVLDRRRAQ
jgi:glycosyltransferase involved in cell wall biosynthesis